MPDFVTSLLISAEAAQIRIASTWLAETSAKCGLSAEQAIRLDHCLDEILMNIIMHGGASAQSNPIGVQFELRTTADTREAAVTISDCGLPFNPLEVVAKPQPTSLADAEPGGLGLLMVRSHADRLDYRFQDGRNHLTFAVRY